MRMPLPGVDDDVLALVQRAEADQVQARLAFLLDLRVLAELDLDLLALLLHGDGPVIGRALAVMDRRDDAADRMARLLPGGVSLRLSEDDDNGDDEECAQNPHGNRPPE